jgi:predicted RNA-binding protein with RPS1 domain
MTNLNATDKSRIEDPSCLPRDIAREFIKSKEEVQVKDEKVQAKIIQIKEKWKKGPSDVNKSQQAATKRQRQLDARDKVMDWLAPERRITTLRERHALALKEQA